MSDDRTAIEELESLVKAQNNATGGPWSILLAGGGLWISGNAAPALMQFPGINAEADLYFVAKARNANLPAILSRFRALERVAEAAKAVQQSRVEVRAFMAGKLNHNADGEALMYHNETSAHRELNVALSALGDDNE